MLCRVECGVGQHVRTHLAFPVVKRTGARELNDESVDSPQSNILHVLLHLVQRARLVEVLVVRGKVSSAERPGQLRLVGSAPRTRNKPSRNATVALASGDGATHSTGLDFTVGAVVPRCSQKLAAAKEDTSCVTARDSQTDHSLVVVDCGVGDRVALGAQRRVDSKSDGEGGSSSDNRCNARNVRRVCVAI